MVGPGHERGLPSGTATELRRARRGCLPRPVLGHRGAAGRAAERLAARPARATARFARRRSCSSGRCRTSSAISRGNELPLGKADVVVVDGFAGNIVMKLTEGIGAGIADLVAERLKGRLPDRPGPGAGDGDLRGQQRRRGARGRAAAWSEGHKRGRTRARQGRIGPASHRHRAQVHRGGPCPQAGRST